MWPKTLTSPQLFLLWYKIHNTTQDVMPTTLCDFFYTHHNMFALIREQPLTSHMCEMQHSNSSNRNSAAFVQSLCCHCYNKHYTYKEQYICGCSIKCNGIFPCTSLVCVKCLGIYYSQQSFIHYCPQLKLKTHLNLALKINVCPSEDNGATLKYHCHILCEYIIILYSMGGGGTCIYFLRVTLNLGCNIKNVNCGSANQRPPN